MVWAALLTPTKRRVAPYDPLLGAMRGGSKLRIV